MFVNEKGVIKLYNDKKTRSKKKTKTEESEGESSGRRKCSVYEPGIVLAEVQ